jgi:hypothetical protein
MGPPITSFFSLSVGRLRGGSGPNNRPVALITKPLEHLRTEDLLGGRNKLDDPVGGAGRSSGVDVPQIPVLITARRQLHHRLHVPRRHVRRHRCGSTLVPSPRGLRDAVLFHHWSP